MFLVFRIVVDIWEVFRKILVAIILWIFWGGRVRRRDVRSIFFVLDRFTNGVLFIFLGSSIC